MFVPVHNSTMSRYNVSKVLDLERSFEARGKETAKGTDDGGKEGHPKGVDKEGINGQGLFVYEQARPSAQSLERQAPFLEWKESLNLKC